jgi:Ca-activated chloride channel family protein
MLVGFLRITLATTACAVLQAQDVKIEPRVRPTHSTDLAAPAVDLKVDAPLVQVPVHVTTTLGATVTDLSQANFRVYEDNVEQKITHFANEDAPISVGLLFDASGSMRNKMKKAIEASAAFFRTSNADDEFFLVEFNERPSLMVPFTKKSDEIQRRIIRTKPVGRTSLLDAIHLAMEEMKTAKNLRKAIVIFSDGGDNRSRYTETEIMAMMHERDVQVYAMGIFDANEAKQTPEEQKGPKLLAELAEETGGRHHPVRNLDDLPEVCARIGNEIRNQYLLGYAPADSNAPSFRRIKVTLVPPGGAPPLKAYYRKGYTPGIQ